MRAIKPSSFLSLINGWRPLTAAMLAVCAAATAPAKVTVGEGVAVETLVIAPSASGASIDPAKTPLTRVRATEAGITGLAGNIGFLFSGPSWDRLAVRDREEGWLDVEDYWLQPGEAAGRPIEYVFDGNGLRLPKTEESDFWRTTVYYRMPSFRAMALLPEGKGVVGADASGVIGIWAGGKAAYHYAAKRESGLRAVAVAPDGTIVAVGHATGQASIKTLAGVSRSPQDDAETWHDLRDNKNLDAQWAPLADIAWAGGQFTAVGDRGLVLTSPNGRDWKAVAIIGGPDLRRVARWQSGWVAAGADGALYADGGNRRWRVLARADTPWAGLGTDARGDFAVTAAGEIVRGPLPPLDSGKEDDLREFSAVSAHRHWLQAQDLTARKAFWNFIVAAEKAATYEALTAAAGTLLRDLDGNPVEPAVASVCLDTLLKNADVVAAHAFMGTAPERHADSVRWGGWPLQEYAGLLAMKDAAGREKAVDTLRKLRTGAVRRPAKPAQLHLMTRDKPIARAAIGKAVGVVDLAFMQAFGDGLPEDADMTVFWLALAKKMDADFPVSGNDVVPEDYDRLAKYGSAQANVVIASELLAKTEYRITSEITNHLKTAENGGSLWAAAMLERDRVWKVVAALEKSVQPKPEADKSGMRADDDDDGPSGVQFSERGLGFWEIIGRRTQLSPVVLEETFREYIGVMRVKEAFEKFVAASEKKQPEKN